MNSNKRRIVVVDRELQIGLSRRLVTYWAGTWFLVFALPVIARLMTDPVPADQLARGILSDFWFPMLVSVFLLPVVIWDSNRFSNRCAGPVYRVGRAMRDLAKGKPVREIRLRPNDFCNDLAESFNQLIEPGADQQDESEKIFEENALETVA